MTVAEKRFNFQDLQVFHIIFLLFVTFIYILLFFYRLLIIFVYIIYLLNKKKSEN